MKLKIIILILLLFAVVANAADTQDTFHEANKAYADGNYAAAEDGYRRLLGEGIESSSIHNNLGEALFRQGKLGESIFQFMLASRLDPRNADIAYNLNYARNRITDKITRPKTNILVRPFSFVEQKMSLKDSWVSFAFAAMLFWGSAILYLFMRKDWLKWIVLVCGIFFMIHSAFLIKKELLLRPFGVVTAVEAPVYSAPGEDNVLLFKLHEGSDFSLLAGKEGNWIQIKLPDGKKGWINEKEIIY